MSRYLLPIHAFLIILVQLVAFAAFPVRSATAAAPWDLDRAAYRAGPNLRTGTVTCSSASWTTVTLDVFYGSMVVIASARYEAGGTPAVVRVKNAFGNSFEVMVQNPCTGTALSNVEVTYLAIEAGDYTEASNGVTAEAHLGAATVTDHAGSWAASAVATSNTYAAPVVLGQVMSDNNAEWSQFWCYDGGSRSNPPSSSGLAVGKHVGEDPDSARLTETIGYLVIEAGSGVFDGLEYVAAVGPDIVQGPDNGAPAQYALEPAFDSLTSVVATQAGMDDPDGGWATVASTSNSSFGVFIEEDQCQDLERLHDTEQVAYVAFGQRTTAVGPNPRTGSVLCSTDSWTTVTLDHSYQSMVVVASAQYAAGDHPPLVVRVQDAEGNSFAVKVQQPCGVTSISGITVDYLAIEEGVFTVAEDGFNAEAFKITPSTTDHAGSWVGTVVSTSNAYTSPVVLGQVMSNNDARWSGFWSYDGMSVANPPSSNGLAIGKHVGDDAITSRSDEILGCVVIEAGAGIMEDLPYAAGVGPDTIIGPDNGPPTQYPLAPSVGSLFTVVVSQTGMDGDDGGWAVLTSRSDTALDLVIEEDQCNDLERSHTTEQVAYIAFGESLMSIFSDSFESGDTTQWSESAP